MKAQFKVLEAIISALILLSFIGWYLSLKANLPETQSLNLRLKIMKALKALDKSNELRELVYSNNTQALEEKLYPYIPKNFDYKVLICLASCEYRAESKKPVYSVSYFLASDFKSFENREVVVYAWEI